MDCKVALRSYPLVGGSNPPPRNFYFGPGLGLPETKLSVPRLELGIFRVLGERHNQLDHTDALLSEPGVADEFWEAKPQNKKNT